MMRVVGFVGCVALLMCGVGAQVPFLPEGLTQLCFDGSVDPTTNQLFQVVDVGTGDFLVEMVSPLSDSPSPNLFLESDTTSPLVIQNSNFFTVQSSAFVGSCYINLLNEAELLTQFLPLPAEGPVLLCDQFGANCSAPVEIQAPNGPLCSDNFLIDLFDLEGANDKAALFNVTILPATSELEVTYNKGFVGSFGLFSGGQGFEASFLHPEAPDLFASTENIVFQCDTIRVALSVESLRPDDVVQICDLGETGICSGDISVGLLFEDPGELRTIGCDESVVGSTFGFPNDVEIPEGGGGGDETFQFSLSETSEVTINLFSFEFDPFLVVQDTFGNFVAFNDNSPFSEGSDAALSLLLAPGDYLIVVDGANSGDEGEFTLSVSCVVVGVPGEFAVLPCDATIQGSTLGRENLVEGIEGDAPAPDQTFVITLEEPTRLNINLESEDFDTFLILQSIDGDLITQNDDNGDSLNSFLSVNLGVGEFLVTADGFSDNSVGVFTLSVVCAPADAGGLAVTPIFCGQTIEGSTVGSSNDLTHTFEDDSGGSGDEFFLLEITQTSNVTISLIGIDYDTVLVLQSAQRFLIAENDDVGGETNSGLDQTLEPGLFLIGVDGFGGEEGTFSLSVECPEQDEVRRIECGETLSGTTVGRLDLVETEEGGTGDESFLFTLQVASPVEIRLVGLNDFDTFLTLQDQLGNFIDSNDDDEESTNSLISTFLEPGDFRIVADGFDDEGEFELSVECLNDPESNLECPASFELPSCGSAPVPTIRLSALPQFALNNARNNPEPEFCDNSADVSAALL